MFGGSRGNLTLTSHGRFRVYQTCVPTDPNLVDNRGIEPRISACKADVFPLALVAHFLYPSSLAFVKRAVCRRQAMTIGAKEL